MSDITREQTSRRRRTPWQRIIRAANKGTGLTLSADDAARLGCDSAIETRAWADDDLWDECPDHDQDRYDEPCPWCEGKS